MNALERYVRRVADLMYMKDWEIEFVTDRPDGVNDRTHATSYLRQKYGSHVELWFNPTMWKQCAPEERRCTVVHELLHALIEVGIRSDVAVEEIVVERLERIVAPTMPLPPKAARP